MGLEKEQVNKIASYIGYSVYALSIVYGGYMIFGDPTTMYGTSPSVIQVGGLLLIAYGIIQIAVTFYNRLPPTVAKTAEQIAINKSKLRERNDLKSREHKLKD